MIEIKHILCPIDYGTCSRRAFTQATALARWYGASITALHVSEHAIDGPVMNAPGSILLVTPPREQRATELEAFVAVRSDASASVNVAVDEGPVAARIVTAARTRQADLIVMGIHGRMNLRYLAFGALGSVTLEVIRSAPCPVLVVPPAARARLDVRYRHIVCPVDFGDASVRAVEYALSMAQETGATLTLLHVLDAEASRHAPRERYDSRPALVGEREAQRALSALVPASVREYCQPVEILASGVPREEILRIADGLQADLIIMGISPRSAAEIMLLGSTADVVLRKSLCPVLTVAAGTR
jgi:nucleotide-binding universal stress UspA family protein